MSSIKFNGKAQELANPVSLTELIKINNVAQPSMVSVQLNGNFVVREDFDTTLLKDGDEVDFLYFMGGGSESYQLTIPANRN